MTQQLTLTLDEVKTKINQVKPNLSFLQIDQMIDKILIDMDGMINRHGASFLLANNLNVDLTQHNHELHHLATHPLGYEVYGCIDDGENTIDCDYGEYRRSNSTFCWACFMEKSEHYIINCQNPKICSCICSKFNYEETEQRALPLTLFQMSCHIAKVCEICFSYDLKIGTRNSIGIVKSYCNNCFRRLSQ